GSSQRIWSAAKPFSAAKRISSVGGRQLPGKNRPSMPMRNALGGDAVQHELCDLDRVQRRALPQVVAREEEGEAALDRRVAAGAADEHVVDTRRGLTRRGELLEADRGGIAEDRRRLLGRQLLLRLEPDRLLRA